MNATGTNTLPLVAVVIPVFKDQVRLKLCLEALQNQTYPDSCFNVVVVDNEPSAETQELCLATPKVRYLVERTPGSYAARNTGLQQASSASIYAFTDSDCIPEADWLENGVAALAVSETCDLVGGRVELFFKDTKHRSVAEIYESVVAFPQKRYVERGGWAVTANLFVRSDVFEKVGYFDQTLQSGGDMEWGKRASSRGMQICYADNVVVRHPARAAISELRAKVRRVAGGGYLRLKRSDPSFYGFARKLVKDLIKWEPDTRRQIRESDLSMTQKLRVYGLWTYLKYVRAKEFLRLRFVS